MLSQDTCCVTVPRLNDQFCEITAQNFCFVAVFILFSNFLFPGWRSPRHPGKRVPPFIPRVFPGLFLYSIDIDKINQKG